MQLNIKALQDIMWKDAGLNGDAQRMEQTAWILFLKMYDYYEKIWAVNAQINIESYTSILPDELKWDAWAKDSAKALTGNDLLEFVNEVLFKKLKNLDIDESMPFSKTIVKKVFEDVNNYMKDGYLLREVINIIDKLTFNTKQDKETLHNTYESFLKTLQSAKNAGEFYTPRALTDFVMNLLDPKIGENIADFACGTGGFFTSAFYLLDSKKQSAKDINTIKSSFYGYELKSLPFILCATNFLINGIEEPNLTHGDAFYFGHFRELQNEKEKFDIIAMNPPYGGSVAENTIRKFKNTGFQSSETADLFVAIIIERLKQGGRAAVVLPDGFLFGDDTPKLNLKKRLLNECDLHLILRLPSGVFAPYTSIATNVLFFNKSAQGTNFTQFYRLDMPENIKSFSKTKPMQSEHFDDFRAWDKSGRATLSDEKGNFKAKIYTKAELEARNYNFDLCGFVSAQEEILSPNELISQIKSERERLNHTLDSLMHQIQDIIKDNE